MISAQQLINSKQADFNNVLDHFKSELSALRTGRASTALVEMIAVEVYGTTQFVRDLAQITIPEPRQIVIQPWDKTIIKNIEKAVQASPLGVNPVNEGTLLRITLPPLTEERRKSLVKIVGQHAERARVAVRNIRETIHKELRRLEEADEISEDERFRGEEQLQKKIDELNKQIKDLAEAKEKEILTV